MGLIVDFLRHVLSCRVGLVSQTSLNSKITMATAPRFVLFALVLAGAGAAASHGALCL